MSHLRHRLGLLLQALVLVSLVVVFATIDALAAPKKVDINTATEKELATVPGISQEAAQLIVEYRDQEGEIESWDEVAKLLREAELRKLAKHLKVGEERGQLRTYHSAKPLAALLGRERRRRPGGSRRGRCAIVEAESSSLMRVHMVGEIVTQVNHLLLQRGNTLR
jgi:competence protein ComEA